MVVNVEDINIILNFFIINGDGFTIEYFVDIVDFYICDFVFLVEVNRDAVEYPCNITETVDMHVDIKVVDGDSMLAD